MRLLLSLQQTVLLASSDHSVHPALADSDAYLAIRHVVVKDAVNFCQPARFSWVYVLGELSPEHVLTADKITKFDQGRFSAIGAPPSRERVFQLALIMLLGSAGL